MVYIFTVFVIILYVELLATPLANLRTDLGIDVWPHEWPLLAQLFLVFFASEAIWYWFHHAEHRFPIVWRLSGHGAHHSFKRLGAINFGTNHPLEMFVILLPSILVELLFGVGVAAAGAGILTSTFASIAHSNLNLNHHVIGWVFTTNRYHYHHHSVVLEESNTNYGCSCILWDRVFGTFADSDTQETGSGPTEPNTWAKFVMPAVQPADVQIAP